MRRHLRLFLPACLAVAVSGVVVGSSPALAATVECSSTYTVRRGDSWSLISHATGIYIRPLAAANGMTRDSALHPDMELCVPVATSANSPRPAALTPTDSLTDAPTPADEPEPNDGPTTGAGCTATHEVVAGESWSSIADANGVRLRSILAANGATADVLIHPGDRVCIPPPAEPKPPRGSCEAVILDYRRAMCMDLSERRAIIGGKGGVELSAPAVGGYGTLEDCAKTLPGTYEIRNKQPITPRRKLRWGMSFGGGCVGDQIVHTVSRATLRSAQGTGGCIGLLEADAKAAYDLIRIGDVVVIVA